MKKLSVVIVEDNPEFLATVRAWLGSQPFLQVVGTAASGSAAVELIAREHPSVVLMDTVLPSMNGFDATRIVTCVPDPPAVIILSFADDEMVRETAIAAGASGFVRKSQFMDDLPPLLAAVLAGQVNA